MLLYKELFLRLRDKYFQEQVYNREELIDHVKASAFMVNIYKDVTEKMINSMIPGDQIEIISEGSVRGKEQIYILCFTSDYNRVHKITTS